MVLLYIATDRIDAGDAQNSLHLRSDDPILDRPQVGDPLGLRLEQISFGCQISAVRLPTRLIRLSLFLDERLELDGPHVDLAPACRDRTHRRRKARWEQFLRVAQPLANLLARDLDVGLFLENRVDLGESVGRYRSPSVLPVHAGESGLPPPGTPLLQL